MKLKFSEYPLNIMLDNRCKAYLKKMIYIDDKRNIDDILAESVGGVIQGLAKLPTIGEFALFSLIDYVIRNDFAKYIKEQTDEVIVNGKDIISVCRETAVIIFIVMQQYSHNKAGGLSQLFRTTGRVITSLIKDFSLKSIGDAFNIETLKLEIQVSEACRIYTLALLMQIFFSKDKWNQYQEMQIRTLTEELLKKRKFTSLETVSNEELFITDDLHILFASKNEIVVTKYVEKNLDNIYQSVIRSNKPALLELKTWIETYYEKNKES